MATRTVELRIKSHYIETFYLELEDDATQAEVFCADGTIDEIKIREVKYHTNQEPFVESDDEDDEILACRELVTSLEQLRKRCIATQAQAQAQKEQEKGVYLYLALYTVSENERWVVVRWDNEQKTWYIHTPRTGVSIVNLPDKNLRRCTIGNSIDHKCCYYSVL